MTEELDLRGLCCPEPLDRTVRALGGKPAELRVLVDDPSARSNIERMGARLGYSVEATKRPRHEELLLRKKG